jgi:thiol-disulfide isomerase/thioredoxin
LKIKKVFIVLSASLLIFSCAIQGNGAKKIEKKEVNALRNNSGDLIGLANQNSLMQVPYSIWFNKGYDTYLVDPIITEELKKHLKGLTIKVFMGTWCIDSKRETPRFYKIASEVGFEKNIELTTVDRSKKTPNNLQEGYNILKVPTFIFFREGKEIGRFVEYPRETIEKDILKIISDQDYKHSYEK